MSKGKGKGKPARGKPPAVIVFGESDNDRDVFRHLLRALAPNAGKPIKLRKVEVLIRGRADAEQRKEAQRLGEGEVKAARVRFDVRGILAHQDCDALRVGPATSPPMRKVLDAERESSGLRPDRRRGLRCLTTATSRT
ncbi:MAG: hypothetical protein H6702_12990 [Myxococcales bacterium]|nr:hypothetical protein [Myxococcales bacterium]